MAVSNLDQAVVIALGSNLAGRYPSRESLLEAAVDAVARVAGPVRVRSSWWRSLAWPDPAAPPFLNGVLLAAPALEPAALLAALAGIERDFGRGPGAANAARPLDLDLIAYGRRRITEPGLVVPHARAHERRFVMGPLAEIAPQWKHPVSGLTAAELAAGAMVGVDATPLA